MVLGFQAEKDAPKAVKPVDDVVGEAAPTLSANEPSERIALLTPREHELFLLLLEGYTLKESAKQLSIKYSTANTHMAGICKKLNVSSRAELIIEYHNTGKKNFLIMCGTTKPKQSILLSS